MRTLLLLSLLVLWVTPAFADVPPSDGFVTDRAGLLDPAQERTLESLTQSYREGTNHEIAILIVKSLEGRPIEEFALQVARTWKIGGKGSNDVSKSAAPCTVLTSCGARSRTSTSGAST